MIVAPGGRCAEFLRLAYEDARQYCVCDDVSDAGQLLWGPSRTDGGEVLDLLGLLHGRLEWRLSAHWGLAAIERSALAGARRPGRVFSSLRTSVVGKTAAVRASISRRRDGL